MRATLITACCILLGSWLVWSGFGQIIDARAHSGRGILINDYGESEEVTDYQYKKYHYTMGVFGVGCGAVVIGLALWGQKRRT